MVYHLPPSQMQILPCPARSRFTLILMAARLLFCVLTWQQNITWCYAQDLGTTWRHSSTDSSSSSLELQLLRAGSGRGNQNKNSGGIITKTETRRGLADFIHFLMSPRIGHHCWAINISAEIKRLSIWKGEKHHKKSLRRRSGLSWQLMSVPNAWNISSASPAFANMLLYTWERELHCLHGSPVMSHKYQIKSFYELLEGLPML